MIYTEFLKYIPLEVAIFEKIEHYVSLLIKWNEKINLISKKDILEIWKRHILDSAQLFKLIPSNDTIIDIGSGNGMPAIILAILGVKKITLVETREKRSIFLQNIIASLNLKNAVVINDRIENLTLETDIITTRAFKDLSSTFWFCQNIKVHNKFLLLKGESIDSEILEAQEKWQFLYKKIPSITDPNSYMIEVEGLKSL